METPVRDEKDSIERLINVIRFRIPLNRVEFPDNVEDTAVIARRDGEQLTLLVPDRFPRRTNTQLKNIFDNHNVVYDESDANGSIETKYTVKEVDSDSFL